MSTTIYFFRVGRFPLYQPLSTSWVSWDLSFRPQRVSVIRPPPCCSCRTRGCPGQHSLRASYDMLWAQVLPWFSKLNSLPPPMERLQKTTFLDLQTCGHWSSGNSSQRSFWLRVYRSIVHLHRKRSEVTRGCPKFSLLAGWCHRTEWSPLQTHPQTMRPAIYRSELRRIQVLKVGFFHPILEMYHIPYLTRNTVILSTSPHSRLCCNTAPKVPWAPRSPACPR